MYAQHLEPQLFLTATSYFAGGDRRVRLEPPMEAEELPEPTQTPIDALDEALMESFPCSDPPSTSTAHA